MIIIDALGGKSGVETNGEEKSLKRFKKIIFFDDSAVLYSYKEVLQQWESKLRMSVIKMEVEQIGKDCC